MSEEFTARVECPHCGDDKFESISFNFMEADQNGCDSGSIKLECFSCFKSFWVKARVSFEVDVHTISKRKLK